MYALLLLALFPMFDELAHVPDVRDAFWRLMVDARYGFAETEEAMFIVRDRDGRLSFVRWSSLHMPHQARWTARLPRGVVAIAHTHPNWMPEPSRTDIGTAISTKLAVYVITRTRVMKTSGGATREVLRNWKP